MRKVARSFFPEEGVVRDMDIRAGKCWRALHSPQPAARSSRTPRSALPAARSSRTPRSARIATAGTSPTNCNCNAYATSLQGGRPERKALPFVLIFRS